MFIFFGQRNRIPAPKLEMLQLQVCRSCSGKYSDGRPGRYSSVHVKKVAIYGAQKCHSIGLTNLISTQIL